MSYMDYFNLDLKYARKIGYSPGVPTPPTGDHVVNPGRHIRSQQHPKISITIKYNTVWIGTVILKLINGPVFFNSGETCEISHIWNESGSLTYELLRWMKKGHKWIPFK